MKSFWDSPSRIALVLGIILLVVIVTEKLPNLSYQFQPPAKTYGTELEPKVKVVGTTINLIEREIAIYFIVHEDKEHRYVAHITVPIDKDLNEGELKPIEEKKDEGE